MLREFAGLHQVLAEQAGVTVSLFQHSEAHGTPDAVFPNNWFSTHAAGEAAGGVTENTLVLYPMKCPNRCVFLSIVYCRTLVLGDETAALSAKVRAE